MFTTVTHRYAHGSRTAGVESSGAPPLGDLPSGSALPAAVLRRRARYAAWRSAELA
jgi:hypothetical protein